MTLRSCGSSSMLDRLKDLADARHPRVVRFGLNDRTAVFQHRHRPEFENEEFAIVEAATPLTEDYRPTTVEPDHERDREQKRRQDDQRRRRNDEIHRAFERALSAAQWRALDGDREALVQAAFRLMAKNVAYLLVGVQTNRQRRVAQQAADFGKRAIAAPRHEQREFCGAQAPRNVDGVGNTSAVVFAETGAV